jgi:hypothetical protein
MAATLFVEKLGLLILCNLFHLHLSTPIAWEISDPINSLGESPTSTSSLRRGQRYYVGSFEWTQWPRQCAP